MNHFARLRRYLVALAGLVLTAIGSTMVWVIEDGTARSGLAGDGWVTLALSAAGAAGVVWSMFAGETPGLVTPGLTGLACLVVVGVDAWAIQASGARPGPGLLVVVTGAGLAFGWSVWQARREAD